VSAAVPFLAVRAPAGSWFMAVPESQWLRTRHIPVSTSSRLARTSVSSIAPTARRWVCRSKALACISSFTPHFGFRGRHSRPETGRRVSRSARHPAAQPYVARDQHRYRSSSHRQAARSHGPAIVPRTDIETFIPFRGPQDHTDTDEYRARTDEAGPQDRQHDRNTRQSACTNKRQFHRADQR
jgi:hypothetical protein